MLRGDHEHARRSPAGAGHAVTHPDSCRAPRPDLVVVVNAVHLRAPRDHPDDPGVAARLETL